MQGMKTKDGRTIGQVLNLKEVQAEFNKIKHLFEQTLLEKEALQKGINEILSKIAAQKHESDKRIKSFKGNDAL